MATAQEVPTRYDLVLNGQGYVLLDTITPSLPFRQHKAVYSLSPTFIDRSNVTGSFGDNQQDWWMTASQNDWSLGEEQKFFRQSDPTSRSRYWRGMNTDLTVPGQLTIGRNNSTLSFASAVQSITYSFGRSVYYVTGVTDLFEVNANGDTVTNRGAHGAGGQPSALATDGTNLYISGSLCTTIRKWNGSAFSTFSTSPASSLAFVNNTIYGFNPSTSTSSFSRWDSTGVPSILFTWRSADGTALNNNVQVIPLGGRVIIIRDTGNALGAELWIFDGNGVSKLQDFEPNFLYHSMCVSEGIVFLIGFGQKRGFTRTEVRYYANGTVGTAYTSQWTTSVPAGLMSIAPFGNGVLFSEPIYNALMYYDLAQGGASTIAPFTASAADSAIATSNVSALVVRGTSTGTRYLASEAASAASIQTSLFDFDSSLIKVVRGAMVDFAKASDGDGGSVDLYYTTDDVSSSFTSIASGITAGTEYPLTGAASSCHSISLLTVLNKGTSTNGPVLKRTYVRAAPVLQQFRRREYVIDCNGDGGQEARELRDGTTMAKSGREQVNDLITLAQSTAPFSVTDRFGTFTGLVDLNDPEGLQIYETHQADDTPALSGTFVVRLKIREV
jgi:hypothetical protein